MSYHICDHITICQNDHDTSQMILNRKRFCTAWHECALLTCTMNRELICEHFVKTFGYLNFNSYLSYEEWNWSFSVCTKYFIYRKKNTRWPCIGSQMSKSTYIHSILFIFHQAVKFELTQRQFLSALRSLNFFCYNGSTTWILGYSRGK